MQIEQKFHVGDQCFNTIEEAENYLANNADQQRVDAFIEYLRQNGAQRISKSLPDTLMEFIKFEKGETDLKESPQPPIEEPEPEVQENPTLPEATETQEEEDNPPFDVGNTEEDTQKVSTTSIFDNPKYTETEEDPPSDSAIFAQEEPSDRKRLFG